MPYIEVQRICKFRFRPNGFAPSPTTADPTTAATTNHSKRKGETSGVEEGQGGVRSDGALQQKKQLKSSVWNCDGEVVKQSAINFRLDVVHLAKPSIIS